MGAMKAWMMDMEASMYAALQDKKYPIGETCQYQEDWVVKYVKADMKEPVDEDHVRTMFRAYEKWRAEW